LEGSCCIDDVQCVFPSDVGDVCDDLVVEFAVVFERELESLRSWVVRLAMVAEFADVLQDLFSYVCVAGVFQQPVQSFRARMTKPSMEAF
jgi:hypothetical protein